MAAALRVGDELADALGRGRALDGHGEGDFVEGGAGTFETELGPVFANLVLADEINRAPAKVQSMARAVVLMARVLASPGTPSINTWPRASSAARIRSSMRSWPTMTRLISTRTLRIVAEACWNVSTGCVTGSASHA